MAIAKKKELEASLEDIPAHVLRNVLLDWSKVNLDLNNVQTGKERKELLLQHKIELSDYKERKIRKIAKLTDVKGAYWIPYSFEMSSPVSKEVLVHLDSQDFPAEKYLNNPTSTVNGIIHCFEIQPNTFLVAVEFKSRAKAYKRIFRYIFFPNEPYCLFEKKEAADDLFKQIMQDKLAISSIQKKKINAMVCYKIANNFIPTKISLLVSNQIAGTAGIDTITLRGQNIFRGIQTLQSRQEYPVGILDLGPWVNIEINGIRISIENGIEIMFLEENLNKVMKFAFGKSEK